MPHALTTKERYSTIALVLCTLMFGVAWIWMGYIERTNAIPAHGYTYTEALVGEPQFINPILLGLNDTNRDIASLVYSGLMKYNENGNVVPDLAERYEISEDGMSYTFFLRTDAEWHDGEKVTVDDVMFTFSAILNPEYGSPQRASLQEIKAEKIDNYTIRLTIPHPYAQFLERMTNGIVPKHVWENINPKNISLAEANLMPIGSGPYRFVKFAKDKYGRIVSLSLAANQRSYNGTPFIAAIDFFFYQTNEDALQAYKQKKVMGVSGIESQQKGELEKYGAHVYAMNVPKYFAVFFNQTSNKALADKNVRIALTHATDAMAITRDVFDGNATTIDSPVLPWFMGYNPDVKKYAPSIETAQALLEESGWKDRDADGIREKTIGKDKEATPLAITLITSDLPDLIYTGELLKAQWEAVGARVTFETYTIDELKQQVIKQRGYEALLFGEALSQLPDPYLFWHSSQRRDPGLNLALYNNKDADALLETMRESLSADERTASVGKFQEILAEDVPAIFLYSPHYLYAVSNDVKNIITTHINTPARRFTAIEAWYIATTRVNKEQ
ncbi:MAG: ABC transporter substrate-binding protein [Candidatus Azambacteria bacterium]|nr:ABC transporter substrate-binding protein [Candidatus Azambacteria bacterium]